MNNMIIGAMAKQLSLSLTSWKWDASALSGTIRHIHLDLFLEMNYKAQMKILYFHDWHSNVEG